VLTATQPDIRRYARRSCRASDVEDAVQEALTQVFRRFGSLRALDALSGWLVAIVHRECLRLAMKLAGRNLEPDLPDDPRLAHRPQAELRLDMARAIQSLPQHYREVVLLRDTEEMTVDEIGAELGLSRESVKGRLHRARTMLREYLLG
jgi:RNA polymerase sigma factor (sigma-70 family)